MLRPRSSSSLGLDLLSLKCFVREVSSAVQSRDPRSIQPFKPCVAITMQKGAARCALTIAIRASKVSDEFVLLFLHLRLPKPNPSILETDDNLALWEFQERHAEWVFYFIADDCAQLTARAA